MNSGIQQCNLCASVGEFSLCSGCQKVAYCSKLCQQHDWDNHKFQCNTDGGKSQSNAEANIKDEARSQTGAKSRKPTRISQLLPPKSAVACIVCDNFITAKKCSQCKSVAYCGVKCQRADWKNHKRDCVVLADYRANSLKCQVCGSSETLKRCSKCKNTSYCSEVCQRCDWAEHNKICVPHVGPYTLPEEIRQRVHDILPNSSIFTQKQILSHHPVMGSVFVARISSYDRMLFHHGVNVLDTDGHSLPLYFYDYLNCVAEPFFQWSDLYVGNYVCIMEPKLHSFLDGRMGFRVNENKTIRIISLQKKDQQH